MAAPRLSISAGAPGGCVCLRLLVAVFIVLILPTQSRALAARLRWAASLDARVQGYYVYVREATRPYGAPRDAGAGRIGGDGSRSWTIKGLSPTATYFVAVSAYTSNRLESSLSNELAIGSPNPCVEDRCTGPASCTVRALPDGAACGPSGVAACGATCLAGVCSGPADRSLTVDRLRVKRGAKDMRSTVKGWFQTSALFDPLAAGLQVTVADAAGAPLVQATLGPADLVARAGGDVIKTARRRKDTAAVRIRRLTLRRRDDGTFLKAQVVASPPPAALPTAATITLQSGALCLSSQLLDCQAGPRALSCR
jgi:hypothetical protein